MKYETKSAQYYKYFEDAKLIDIDDDNKKLAIVLNGKEEIINIFDAGPYIDYNPYENYIKEIKAQSYEDKNNKKYGILQIQEESNYLDINEIFQEIKNYKRDYQENINQINNFNNHNSFNLNSDNKNNLDSSKKPLVEGKNLFIHNKYQTTKNKNDSSALSRMITIFNQKNTEKIEKKNDKNVIKKYTFLSKSKFHICYLSPIEIIKNFKINIKKPKIKHKLLSVITLINDSALGIKWFFFNKIENELGKKSEIENYIQNSKLLLVVGQEGLIGIYQLTNYQPFNHIRVNLTLSGLQSQPFSNYKERYNLAASLKVFNPIIDYNLLDKPLTETNQIEIRLITLHINNTFTFWKIVNDNNQIKLSIIFNFQLSSFICENFLMDSNEEYLICFNKKGIMILFAKYQIFPYPIVYRYTYNETIPSLKELKDLIYSNEVIPNEEDENEEIQKEKKNYKDTIKNDNNGSKKKLYNKNKKKKKLKPDEKKRNLKKDKYKNIEKETIKKQKQKKKLTIIKENENEEEEDDNEYNNEDINEDEEEDEEKDEFFVEGNPNFINTDEDIFLDDDKYLKFLQKPCFLSFETKFLFVNYEIKTNQYSLYCFNFSELLKVEEDQNFLSLCLNEYDDMLITKIYTSKEKIYFSESPFCYFNPIKDNSINNNLISTVANRKILRENKYEFNTIFNNLYEGLFIREGDNIMIIKLDIRNKPDLELIRNDINLSKFVYYEQPTSENLKSNYLAKWTINNTLIINSVDCLFSIIKFRKEDLVLGIPIAKKKVIEFMKLNINK